VASSVSYHEADVRGLGIGVTAAAAVCAAGLLGALGVPANSYRNGDFLQFWVQPQALFEGASPYDPAWWAAIHARLGARPLFDEAVYPPYDAIAFLPIALFPLSSAAAIWLVAQLVAVAVTTRALARRISDRAGRSIFLAVVLGFQPLWLLVVGGNVTGFLFAAVGGAYLAAFERRIVRCGAFLGVLAIKPHPFVFLALAMFVSADRSERRALALGAFATAGPLVLGTLLLRPSWYADWLPAAFGLQSAPGSNATIWTIGRLIGREDPVIGAVVALAVVIAFGVWSRRARPALALGLAVAIPVSLAVAPHGWSYDHLLLLVPLAVAIDRIGMASVRRRGSRAVLALAASALPWSLYLIAFGRGGEELSVITPLAVFVVMAALWSGPGAGQPRRRRPWA